MNQSHLSLQSVSTSTVELKSGESVTEFAAELRRLATHCQFGTHLNEALRDRLMCGLSSEAAQKRL